MLQGRNANFVRSRRGRMMPGSVPTRNLVFRIRHGRKIETFNTLGSPGTDDIHTALGFRRAYGGKIVAVWDEK